MASIQRSIEIDVPVQTAYNQWTQFEELPHFMHSVDEVRQIDETHLHWVATIGSVRREWDAEITEQIPDQRIAWRATHGHPNGGVVTFDRLAPNRTRVTVEIEHEPQGVVEKLGDAVGADDRAVEADLERFKALVEERGSKPGGWRGEVHAGTTTSGVPAERSDGQHADGGPSPLRGQGGPDDAAPGTTRVPHEPA